MSEDPASSAAERIADALEKLNRTPPTLWRVDIAGRAVSVHGEQAYEFLHTVNTDLARMKMALHRITHIDPAHEGAEAIYYAQRIARGALKS